MQMKHVYCQVFISLQFNCQRSISTQAHAQHRRHTHQTNEQQLNQQTLVAAFWRWWKVVITLWSLCAVSRPRWGESGIFIVTCEGQHQHQHQQSLQQTVGTTWLNWDLTQCLSPGDLDIFSFIYMKVFTKSLKSDFLIFANCTLSLFYLFYLNE